MNCCFIAHSAKDGGAERVLLETIQLLQPGEIGCRVVFPEDGPLCHQLREMGVATTILSFPHWMARGKTGFGARLRCATGTLLNVVSLVWKLYRWKSDVVYSNTVTFCVGGLAARILRIPHIWHVHEFGFEDQGLSFVFGKRFSLGLVNRLSTRCICVSHALARRYEESVEALRITVIYPWMHRLASRGAGLSDGPAPCGRGRFRCALVGALLAGKRQEDAICATGLLANSGLDIELLLVGDGDRDYQTRLEELIRTEGLDARVSLMGRINDPSAVVRSSDVVLMCSVSEAFGRATVEGMLAGKPVIGARAGATAELIDDGVTGLLYTPEDAVDLARKIRTLYENRSLAQALGENAQRWASQQFTSERCRGELLAVFESVS